MVSAQVTCNLDAGPLMAYTSGLAEANPPAGRGVNDTDHVVEVVGWGVTAAGVDFWEIRNSWGEYWGDAGFGRVLRGVDDSMIESSCTWAEIGGWGAPGPNWQAAPDAGMDAIAFVHAPAPWAWEPARGGADPVRAALLLLVVAAAAAVVLRRRAVHAPTTSFGP